jgi:hypothetical protein
LSDTHQMRRKPIRTPKQIERPTTISLRQDEQEDWLQTGVGLAAYRQCVRRGVERGGIRIHTERSKYLLTFSSSSRETMSPRSCEYCFGSISWDARPVPVSSFRVGLLQYKRICVVSRFANAKSSIATRVGHLRFLTDSRDAIWYPRQPRPYISVLASYGWPFSTSCSNKAEKPASKPPMKSSNQKRSQPSYIRKQDSRVPRESPVRRGRPKSTSANHQRDELMKWEKEGRDWHA